MKTVSKSHHTGIRITAPVFENILENWIQSCPLLGISTLWLGYCSCSCCWCQREAMPCYLAPHWSLSPLCHHRVALRLEEDDNERSKQQLTINAVCYGWTASAGSSCVSMACTSIYFLGQLYPIANFFLPLQYIHTNTISMQTCQRQTKTVCSKVHMLCVQVNYNRISTTGKQHRQLHKQK